MKILEKILLQLKKMLCFNLTKQQRQAEVINLLLIIILLVFYLKSTEFTLEEDCKFEYNEGTLGGGKTKKKLH